MKGNTLTISFLLLFENIQRKAKNLPFCRWLASRKKTHGYGIRLLALGTAALLVFVASETSLAEYANYNRPNALMDYVPQEIGIYDSVYWELGESDCRGCHGDSLADRHHLTDVVVIYNLCTPCHEVIEDPPYVVAIRDCTTSGCHSWDDVYTNGWHHNTDLSGSDTCVACHNPNLIAEMTPVRDPETYPPSIVTPTPFSCENCHWGQDHWATGDPDSPGHPSTYDHYDAWGNFIGFFEYPRPIYGNSHTHHMGFKGNVASECYTCHSLDPYHPDWDPYNPVLIRACEVCHTPVTLHGVGPHVHDTNGWEAIGFHVPYSNTMTRDVDPTVYRTWDPTGPYVPEMDEGFTVNQMCFGCHGDKIPDPPPVDDCDGNAPLVDNTVAGIQPKGGTCGTSVTLRGQNFGEEGIEGRDVQMKLKGEENPWIDVPIVSWVDTRIEFQIPCSTFTAGNYKVRVTTECGESNIVNFTLKEWSSIQSISPNSGPCGTWITMLGANFGQIQSKIFRDGYHGIHRIVEFVSSQGTYTAKHYQDWSDTRIRVRFRNFFEDDIDRNTGEQNFVQDDGSGECPIEPSIGMCGDLAVGIWSVYVTTVYFGDDDANGGLSCGDTIFQVAPSDPVFFELTNAPTIFKRLPSSLKRFEVLKIFGENFGPVQVDGEVRIGELDEAKQNGYDNPLVLGLGDRLDGYLKWTNTVIKVKLRVDPAYQNKIRWIWVEKDGKKTNYKPIEILPDSD